MRRLIGCLFVLAALAGLLASAAAARPAESGDARSLELIDGDGSVSIQLGRGVVLGQVDRGRLTVAAGRRGQVPAVQVSGAQSTFEPNARTTVYVGRDLRFSVQGGGRVELRGVGIDASIVCRCTVSLHGSGSMKLDSEEPPEEWSDDREQIVLGG